MHLSGKRIILGVTGSIAAYKSAPLCRLLKGEGADVQVITTRSAEDFVSPLTLSVLSGKPVLSEMISEDNTWNNHIDLGMWADLFLIAPLSAHTLSAFATGTCENLLQAVYLSARCPVFVAPAMDLDMFAHPITQRNLEALTAIGNKVIEPASGELASGLDGKGRMEEPEKILRYMDDYFTTKGLLGRKILITAGPTYEKIDPVRFVGNYSTGKMGFALAESCAKHGADVCLIAGPVQLKTIHPNIERIDVESASEMYNAVMDRFYGCDGAILCAAVADFTPVTVADIKVKREKENLQLELKPTQDIATEVGKMKMGSQFLVGFALDYVMGFFVMGWLFFFEMVSAC